MTGVMSSPVNPGEWPIQAAICRAVGGVLRPFDVYLGPYVEVEAGWLFYAETDDGGASVVLWPNGVGPAFVTPHEARCKPRAKSAMNAALDVLKMAHRH